MRLQRGMKPGRLGSGSLLASLLWVAMAHANLLDPAEHLGFWIDEGITPPAVTEYRTIGLDFVQDDELPLDGSRAVSALAVHGRLEIFGATGHVRITLIDAELRQHLVLEAYPMMLEAQTLTLEGVCRETCLLGSVTPHRLRIELADATLRIDRLEVRGPPEAPVDDLPALQEEIRSAQADAIVARINARIAAHGLDWEAGKTAFALLSFEQRRAQASSDDVPVFHGFEYYVGGTFALPEAGGGGGGSGGGDGLVARFDWRKRHNAHLSRSPYYDGDPTGSGWMTRAHLQKCSDCWAHAAIGLLEAHVNLTLNRQRDIDLSEQHVVSCSGAGNCEIGYISRTLDYLLEHGAVPEGCLSYAQGPYLPCSAACEEPILRVRIDDVIPISRGGGEAGIKRALIEYGPMVFRRECFESTGPCWSQTGFAHYLVLVGFDTEEETGRTIWIVKNSWGESWGHAGFGRFRDTLNDMDQFYAVTGVQLLKHGVPVRSLCRDEDGDGYAVWGLGRPKPRDCHSKDGLPDCNDNNPRRGPALPSGKCLLLTKSNTGGGEPVGAGDPTPVDSATGSGGGGAGAGLFVLVGIALLVWRRPPRLSG